MKNPMFAFAACLRHAFMTGAGYGDDDHIAVADIVRWTEYDPPSAGSFKKMNDIIAAAGHDEYVQTVTRKELVETMGAVKQTIVNTEEFEAAMRRASEAIREILPVKRTTTGVVIVAAAIRVDGKFVLSVPAPGRHHDIINAELVRGSYAFTEGFLTSAGTFVDRENALELAIKAGQYNAPAEGKRELFSEDLW